jgi:hypothetical protein
MQEIVASHMIEVNRKVLGEVELPKTLILYTVDAEHFVLASKPLQSLDETALTKTRVSVALEGNKFLIKLPAKVYNFCRIEESDYTIMASNKDPATIIIAV